MKLSKVFLSIPCFLVKKAAAFLFFVVLFFSANTLCAQCMDLSGKWYVSQTGTLTISYFGESFTEDISGSNMVTIDQNGCNPTFLLYDAGPAGFTGTILGSNIQITGELAKLLQFEDGLTFTQNILTGSGTISEDGSNISMTASGYASGAYEGTNFTATGFFQLTFTRYRMTASGSLLYVGFGFGTEMWDGSAWTQLSPADPQNMVASGSLLYVDYGTSGTWMYNGSTWTNLSPADPRRMVASGSSLYADYGSSGTWMWNGSTWTQLSPANPQDMVAASDLLYADYGTSGTWMYKDSAWTQLSPADPQDMVVSGDLLYADYGTFGDIWMWNGSEWTDLYW